MARRFPPADEVEIGYYDLSAHLLALRLMDRGYRVRWHSKVLFTTRIGDEPVAVWCTRSLLNDAVAALIANSKTVATTLLRAAGVAVPTGRTFRDLDAALDYTRRIGFPVIAKPANGRKGQGATVAIGDEAQLRGAWRDAGGEQGTAVVVQRHLEGEEARILVLDGRVLGVVHCVPPRIVGDGRHTLGELVEQRNEVRRANPHLRTRLIELDRSRIDRLRRLGLGPDTVVDEGVEVVIDPKGALPTGGDSVVATDRVHPSVRKLALDAVAAVPGLRLAGVDLICADLSRPLGADDHGVLEVNSMPALGSHHFPRVGPPTDVAEQIVAAIVAEARLRQRARRRAQPWAVQARRVARGAARRARTAGVQARNRIRGG